MKRTCLEWFFLILIWSLPVMVLVEAYRMSTKRMTLPLIREDLNLLTAEVDGLKLRVKALENPQPPPWKGERLEVR